jgi:RNA polymerase sigma-70 factor (ECF subfamily)
VSQSTEPNDDLAARMRAGDHAALAELFRRHRDRLWHVVQFRLDARLRRRIDPDDVLQQAFLDATKRLGHFRGDSDTGAFVWLRLIVLQTMVDLHRAHVGAGRRDAGRDVELVMPDNSSAMLAQHLAGTLTSPSMAAARVETEASLRSALDALDPVDREVLALRHFEELGNSEAAAVLGIDPKAASKRYVRALDRLREIMEALPGAGTA